MAKHQLAIRVLMPLTLILLIFTTWSVSAQADEVDLVVEKIAPAIVGYDATLDYIVRVTNAGDATATGVTLLDTLPTNYALTNVTPGAPTCQENNGLLACGLGTLEPGEFAFIRVQGSISASTSTYDVSATNGAPFAVDSLTLSHVLPTGETALSVNPSPTCSIAGQTVSCVFTNVEASGTRTATVEIAGGGDVTASNVVTAAADQTESNNANNDDSVNTIVTSSPPATQAPVMLGVNDRRDAEGDSISLQVLALDADQDALTYGATNLPDGINIDSNTGLISGTLAAGSAGIYTVTVSVNDGFNPVLNSTFSWEVTGETIPDNCALVQEAEDAEIRGLLIRDDPNASGGQYVVGPGGYFNTLDPDLSMTFCFYVPVAGEYKLVGNVYGTANNQDSFHFSVNGGPVWVWDTLQNSEYLEDEVNTRYPANDPLLLDLPQGVTTVMIGLRESLTRLDKLALVSTSANTPPTTTGIADVDVLVNAAPTNIDLYAAFDDAEDADADLTYSIAGNTDPSLFSDLSIANGVLTLTYAADAPGSADITVQAQDTGGLDVETTFTVTVAPGDPSNTPPTTTGIADVNVLENAAPTDIDLYAAFDDAEDADADLTYAITGNTNPTLFSNVSIANGVLTLDFDTFVTGTSDITLTVTDTGLLTVEETFTVTVTAGDTTRVTQDLLALYTFEEGSGNTVYDVGGVGAPLNLTVETPGTVQWGSGTLTMSGAARIASPGAATKLHDAITATGAFTVEAWIMPANTSQDGPARIVTYSGDKYSSNFTLGQSTNYYAGRIRTTNTNGVGAPSTDSAPGSATTNLTHVVLTRDAAGNTQVYINGTLVQSGTAAGTLNWDDAFRFGLGNEFGADRSWLGTYYLVAVYQDALGSDEVQQNYDAGPGSGQAPGNTPPTTIGLPDVTTTSNAPDTVINLGDYFDDAQDADNELTYAVTANDNPSLLDVLDITGTTMTLGYIENTSGVANITVTATDTAGLFVSATFSVTVIGEVEIETVRIMPVGDSITAGRYIGGSGDTYTSYRRPLWFDLQNGGYNVDFVGDRQRGYGNKDFDMDMSGDGGWPAQWVVGNITNWMVDYDPDIILLHIGTNDLLRGEGEANAIADIQEIISRVRNVKPDTIIFIAQVFPLDHNGYTEDLLNAQIATLSNLSTPESPIIIVDQNTGINLATQSYDNIHPNLAGEEEMAVRWFAALTPILDGIGAGGNSIVTAQTRPIAPTVVQADEAPATPDVVIEREPAPAVEVPQQEVVVITPEVTEEPIVETTPEVTEEPAPVVEVPQQEVVVITPEVTEAPAALPPVVQPLEPQQSLVGDVVELAVLAQDPEGSALRYATDWETGIETLPDGLSIDPATGIISGTVAPGAEIAGTYNVLVTVIDGDGLQTSITFTWTVSSPAEPQPEATEELAPETTPEVTTQPVETTPEVTEEPAPETTPEAPAQPVTEVAPEVTEEPAPETTPEAPAQPVTEVAPEATQEVSQPLPPAQPEATEETVE